MTRLGALAAVVAAGLVFPATSAGDTERCCFLVDARASGWLSLAGADLAAPGATAYRARWRWRVWHVARYVEHGRIFNALTRLGTDRLGGLSLRFSEERAGLRTSTCRRKVSRDVAGRSEQAYVSLEDTTEGAIALVVRADHRALRSRCSPASALPTAHVRPAPAGVVLRRARALSLVWRDPIRLEDGHLVGSVAVRVRLVVVPPSRVAPALRRGNRGAAPESAQLASSRPSSRTRLRTCEAKSGSGGASARPRPRRDSSVVRNER